MLFLKSVVFYQIPAYGSAQLDIDQDIEVHIPLAFGIQIPNQNFGDIKPVSQKEAEEIEYKTRLQSKIELWHLERSGRLTASVFHEVCRKIDKIARSGEDVPQTFLNRIYKPKYFTSAATLHGTIHETVALEQYARVLKKRINPCGLVINPTAPFLGASPDGLVFEEGGTLGLVEVKCPYSVRNLSIGEAVSQKDFFLELSPTTGEFLLKQNHKHYFQVQGQLLVTGLPFCDFVTYTHCGLNIERIKPNANFMDEMYKKLFQFHFGYGIPHLSASVV